MRPFLSSTILLLAIGACSSDAVGPTVDAPNFDRVSAVSAEKCFALAKLADANSLRIAENNADEIIVDGEVTEYVGVNAVSPNEHTTPAPKRRTVTPSLVSWFFGVTHMRMAYTTDGSARALVQNWQNVPSHADPGPMCNTF